MSQFEPDDDLGNPWLAIALGIASLVCAWFVYAKLGVDPKLIAEAAVANSGVGRELLIGLCTIVGAYFLVRGVAKLRSNE